MREAFRGGWPFGHPPNTDFDLNWRSPQADGLVMWLPLGVNRSTGTRYVDRVKSLSFAEINTPAWVVGERGWNLDFDGTEGLAVGIAAVAAPPFSLAGWARPTDLASLQSIIGIFETGTLRWGLELRGNAAGDPVAAFARSVAQGQAVSTVGWNGATFWGHACAVFPEQQVQQAYFNGGNRGNAAIAIGAITPDETHIAHRTGLQFLTGGLSDLRIYDIALSDAMVHEIYSNPWELIMPRVRFWPGFADGCVTTVTVTETATVTVVAQV